MEDRYAGWRGGDGEVSRVKRVYYVCVHEGNTRVKGKEKDALWNGWLMCGRGSHQCAWVWKMIF